ncbi:putative gustatory receptor [Trypoxylus dichotomus]
MLAQYYLQPDMLLWHTFGYYHILAMLNCLCTLWFINCTAKGRVAKDLAQNLHNALESADPASKLAEYRDLWVDLSHMMQQLGKAYSGMYGMYCILILMTTIVASYGCLTEIMDHGLSFKEAGLFLIAFYCMSLLYIICNEAHHISSKMGPEFRERLLNVNLMSVDSRTRQEVHMFLTAIDKNPPIMNLNQYTDINRKLISSVSIDNYL